MKPLSLPYLLIGCIITFFCNYARAQNPTLQISKNPTTCHGSEGSITFSGLIPNTPYQVRYLENGAQKGPVTLTTDATGQISLPNLTQGAYRNFTFTNSGTTLSYVGGAVLSDPILDPPTFNFSNIIICIGDPAPPLPPTSNNGYTGSWSPAVIDPTHDGTYTFTPNITCADPVDITVTVTPKNPVTFPFGTGLVICGSGPVPVLTNTSIEGITGSWTPTVVDPTRSGTYVFTPTVPPPGCLTGTTFTLILNPIITPLFSFGTSNSICTGGSVPTLPTTSDNGITGSWTPAVVDPNSPGIHTYIFTPDPGQCARSTAYVLTIKPIIPPVFSSFPNSAVTICSGDPAPVLPTASDIGQTGTWMPAIVSNTVTGTYVFTSTSDPCAPPTTVTVNVNPIITPAFSFGTSQSVCINTNPPALLTLSNNRITGTWSPAVIDNQNSGTYTFTPVTGQCAVPITLNYQVNPIPSFFNSRKDTVLYDGDVMPSYDFPVNIPVTGINWTNNNPGIGLQASGSGTVPSFTATNMTNDSIVGVVSATPYVNGCMGATQSYKITVKPKYKDIYVPNVFSPNGDNKNNIFYVYGNYIATLELHIFNQWGQKMITITDKSQGWDGRFKGSPQPVGVYVYILKATTTDGRTLNRKGSITLVR